MEQLTDKQIKARAYHAENKDRRNAQKRNGYGRKTTKGRAIVIAPSKNRKSKPVELTERKQPALSRAEDLLDELKASNHYF
jgi:hypothetical protein